MILRIEIKFNKYEWNAFRYNIKEFFRKLFTFKCPKCGGRVRFIGEDLLPCHLKNVYQCDKCESKFI